MNDLTNRCSYGSTVSSMHVYEVRPRKASRTNSVENKSRAIIRNVIIAQDVAKRMLSFYMGGLASAF